MSPLSKPARLQRVTKICLALPEATSEGSPHVAFRVRGKTFLYYLDNHHGDGRIAVNCKVSPGEQDVLIRMDPARFFVPAYLGARGWVGVRIDLKAIDWDEIEQLVRDSYRLVAPKRLAALVASA